MNSFARKKVNFLLALALMVSLAGCTLGAQDINTFVKQLPQVKQFLTQYPNADISVVLLDENIVRERMDRLEEACGFPVPVQEYYFVTIDDPPETVYVLLTAQQAVQCLVRFGPGSPSGQPAPEPPTATTLDQTPIPSDQTTTPSLPSSNTPSTSTKTTSDPNTNVDPSTLPDPSKYIPTHDPTQASIYGTILNAQGNPEEAMAFLIELDNGNNWNKEIAFVQTEANGYYEFPKVPEKAYQLFVAPDESGVFTELVEIQSNSQEKNIQLSEPHTLTIIVQQYSNSPLANAYVQIQSNGITYFTGRTDEDGKLEMPQMTEGEYDVLVTKNTMGENPSYELDTVQLPQTEPKIILFPLSPANILITATDAANQQPISDFESEFVLNSNYSFQPLGTSTTGLEQMYSGLPVHEYALNVHHPNYKDYSEQVQITGVHQTISIEMVKK